jgi:type I restriction enzyme M protein
MKIAEFGAEATWWGEESDGFKHRVENEYAWRVSLEDANARNFSLDCKKPQVGVQEIHDPEVLLAQYATMQHDITALRNQLKSILGEALQSSPLKTKS